MKTIHRIMRIQTSGLTLLALFSFFLPTAHAANVDDVHPRIFFYVDSLSTLRARAINGPNRAIYERFAEYVEELPTTEVWTMHYFAAMYQLTQNPQYASVAINLALRAVNEGMTEYCHGEGKLFGQMSTLVLTYDWCYERMTEAQRQTVQNCLLSGIDNVPNGYRQMYEDRSWQYKYVLANDTASDSEVQEALDTSIDYLRDRIIPCYNELKPNGAEDNYFGKYYSLMFIFMDVLKHAGNLDLIEGCNAMSNSWRFWTAIYRPDRKMRRLINKWNMSNVSPVIYFAWQGSRLGSRHAQALANMLVNDGVYDANTAMYLLLWYNPELPADPLEAGELDWYDPYGWYVGRTGWNFSAASTDVTAFFNMQPFVGDSRGSLHYDIIRGPDDLITKNSYYEGDIDLHYAPWLTQAHAFNTILVYDPAEDFGTYLHQTYGSPPTHRPMPNTGQQGPGDRDEAVARWPRCTWTGEMGYAGEMEEPSTTVVRNAAGEPVATQTTITADATAGYSPAKVSKVTRTWSWRRPDWFIVKDRVVLAKDGLPVKSLIHCVNKPEIGMTPTTIRGDWSRGGVFSAPVGQTMVLNSGNSSARVYVLQATGDGTPSSELRIIGGASRNDENWRQNQVSNDFGYVANANDISYEFFIEQTEQNYNPSDSWRVKDEDVANRHMPTHLAGDWRVEITVNGGRGTVDITYLVHVTQRNAPVAQVSVESVGNALWARVTNGSEILMFDVCEDCPGMAHQ